MSPRLFPTVLIVLQGAAALRYLAAGDVKQAMYWALCSAMAAVVTFL